VKFKYQYQSSGLLYNIFVQTTQLGLFAFLRKIHFHNIKGVPTDKPVILAVNHPTAFIDPLLLCGFLEPPIYNMTRGDIFEKPFWRKVLESCNMFPVFRAKDGYTDRNRNDEVFNFIFEKLTQRRVVTIYVEGEHHIDKRLRPIQKGIVRIAFGAMEQRGDLLHDLQIIPVGVNYVAGDQYRDEAMVNVGAPIMVRDYLEAYQENPNVATHKLSNAIRTGLKPLCFQLEHEGDDALAEQMLTLHRSEHSAAILPPQIGNNDRFLREKTVLDELNALTLEEKEGLKNRVNTHFNELKKYGLEDFALLQPKYGEWKWLLFIIIGFVPYLVGRIFALPFSYTAQKIADAKAKKREFYSSVLFGAAHTLGIIWYSLIIIIALISLKPLWIAFALLIPIISWFSVIYVDIWKRFYAVVKAQNHPQLDELIYQRCKIKDF
jgi:glycerol-3-phosphate O-acyltransferase / dihydroxyacetone phosphate acyltransferase